LLAAGDLPDYTYLWWDVRPHPNLGTVEVRVMDAQAPLERVAGLAALIHGLAIHEALSPRRGWPPRDPTQDARVLGQGPRAQGAALQRRPAPVGSRGGARRRGAGSAEAARAERRGAARRDRPHPERGRRRRPPATRIRRWRHGGCAGHARGADSRMTQRGPLRQAPAMLGGVPVLTLRVRV